MGDTSFADAMVIASNPIDVALAEATRLWPNRPIELILSLGSKVSAQREVYFSVSITGCTGITIPQTPDSREPKDLESVVRTLLRLITDSEIPDFRLTQLKERLGIQHYIRLSPISSTEGAKALQDDTAELLRSEDDKFKLLRSVLETEAVSHRSKSVQVILPRSAL